MILGFITLGAFIWTLIISAGLAYLGGKLLAPDAPKAEGEVEGAASRLWNPHSTQQEGLPRGRSYGKNLHHGNIVAKWTEVVDNREVLFLVVDHGDGPTKGVVAPIEDNIFLNDQPLGNFGDVIVQERIGTMDQTCMTGFEKPKLEYVENAPLLKDEPIVVTTPNDFFDDLEWTILFPNGLNKRQKDGDLKASVLSFKVRIRVHPAGEWVTIFNSTLTAATTSPRFVAQKASTLGFSVVRGTQYDLEFTNLTGPGERHVNDVQLRSFREIIDTAFTRPGKALVGIRAVATNKLSGSLDVKIIREDRIINVYDGSTWTLEYSNNRAWVAWDVTTQPVISGNGDGTPWAIARYEGLVTKHLDLEFFYTWAQFCEEEILDGYGGTEARCACNMIIGEFADVFTTVHKIAEVGRAYLYQFGNYLTGWIDTVVTTPIDLVTMDSMMSKTWKNAWAIAPELAGQIEVFYQDEKQGYERTPAKWSNDDSAGYKNTVSLEGIGLNSRGTAIHYAHYLLERTRLIRNTNNFRVHKEGFRYKLGEVIKLQCRIANWGSAFRVMSSTADTITVDRDVESEVSVGDVIHIRTYSTILKKVISETTYEVDSVLGKVITATVNWDVTPIKGNLVAVGPAGAIKLRRLVKLTPTIDNYFDVEVEAYDVDLFDADDVDPANPNVNYIWPSPVAPLDAPMTRAEVYDLVSQMIPGNPNIDIPWPSNITWNDDTPDGDSVSWSKTDADDDITFRLKGTSHIITPDDTNKEFIYWDPNFPTVFTATDVFPTAELLAGSWLMCRNLDGIAYPANAVQLLHAGIIMAGTIFADKFYDEDGLIVGVKTDVWTWQQNGSAKWNKSLASGNDKQIIYDIKQFYCEGVGQEWQARLRTKWIQVYHQGHGGSIRPELWVGGVQKWTGTYRSSYNAWQIFNWGPIILSDYGMNDGDTVQVKLSLLIDTAAVSQHIHLYCEGYPEDKVTTQSPYGELLKE